MNQVALYLAKPGIEMSVKLLSESNDATITDEDTARIDEIIAFWFKEQELSAHADRSSHGYLVQRGPGV